TMTFTADTITAAPAGWRVTGHLTARNTTVRLIGDAEVTGYDRSATVTAHTRLDRRTLGIRAPRIMIGHVIDITVTAALRLSTPQQTGAPRPPLSPRHGRDTTAYTGTARMPYPVTHSTELGNPRVSAHAAPH